MRSIIVNDCNERMGTRGCNCEGYDRIVSAVLISFWCEVMRMTNTPHFLQPNGDFDRKTTPKTDEDSILDRLDSTARAAHIPVQHINK